MSATKKRIVAGLQVETVAIDSLREDPHNLRRHGKRNLSAIKSSLEAFGQVLPLVVQKGTGIVVGGNGTLSQLREMGKTTVDIVEVELTEERARALSIALNRTSDLASWDEEGLTNVLSALQEGGLDLTVVGFDSADLTKRFEKMRELAVGDLPDAPTNGSEGVEGNRVASDHVRQVQLFMPTSLFETFQQQLASLMDRYATDNITDTVLRAVGEVHEAHTADGG